MTLLALPLNDHADFRDLPEDCRCEVRRRLRAMERLADTGRGIQAAIAREAGLLGTTPKSLRRWWDNFRHSGYDWRTLVDRARWPIVDGEVGVPAAVVELYKELCERNQRKCKPAFRELQRMYQRGEPAGFAWPPHDAMTGMPRGVTYSNLQRKANASSSRKYELALARIGRGAASAMLPKVLTTRAPLLVGQLYVCDDQDYDVTVAMVGVNRKITRPSGFNTLDLKSACEILWGYKPTVLNADGSKQKLKQVDFQWHLVSLLTTIGYRADTGTLIVGEHGTANAGTDFAERVALATGGKVTFDASGIHGEQLTGLFRGQPRGNPKYKAARESWFGLLRNEMALLPGPTGMDRAHAPEENYGLEKYARDILDAITARPDLAEALRLPVQRWTEFQQAVDLIVRQINRRTEHDLEGWADCVASEWRLMPDQPWMPASQLLTLPAPQRTVADAMIAQTPGLWRVRKQSPQEVWESGRAGLMRVDGAMIPVLLGPDGARPVRVTDDHQIVIEDAEIEADAMWFDAELRNGRMLQQGQELSVYLNPFTPQDLQVCDPAGRWLGTAPRVERLSKLDVDGLRERYGKVRRIETRLLTPVAARGAKVTRERIAMRTGNANLLGGMDAERAAEKQTKSAARLGAAVLTEEPPQEVAVRGVPAVAEEWNETLSPSTQTPTETW
jgi:hypothetical protein